VNEKIILGAISALFVVVGIIALIAYRSNYATFLGGKLLILGVLLLAVFFCAVALALRKSKRATATRSGRYEW